MLSAVVLTKNEQDNIAKCLESLEFCDETITIDDFSTDKTVEFSKKYKAKIIQHALNNNFSAQRNFALSQIKSGWILFVDADEVISPELASEIKTAITRADHVGFYLPREDILWGHRLHHGDTRTSLLRLARRGAGEWRGRVHETWVVSGRTGTLASALDHYPHPTITDFLNHINYYSTLRARELRDQGQKPALFPVLFYPPAKFLWLWLGKLGFLDGTPGFISAMIMAFYTFLTRGKLYLT